MDTNEVISGSGLGAGLFDNVSTGALLASVWWGGLGSAMALYGWRQKSMVPLFTGLAMVAVSYFFWNSTLYMSLAGVLILVVFFWLKKQDY